MKKIFYSLILIFLSIGLVFYFFTLQTFQFFEISRMKLHGVTEVVDAKFDYFEKNNCISKSNCRCVLLIHGLGDFALTWRQMMSLDKNAFTAPVHFFAPNLPGALDTPKLKSAEDYNVQKVAQMVSEYFLPRCDSWTLVGNSYGGWLSIFMSLKSEKIKSLLLLSPAGLNKDYSHLTKYFLNPTVAGAKDFYHRLYAKPKNLPDYVFVKVVERLKTQPVLDQLQSVHKDDFVDNYLGNIKVPTTYFWGDSDRVIPTDWSEIYKQKTPGAKLTIAKECGHVPQKECLDLVLLELNMLLSDQN